jgi:hypothetical protein
VVAVDASWIFAGSRRTDLTCLTSPPIVYEKKNRFVRLFVRDFRTAQEDQAIALPRQVPTLTVTLGTKTSGPKYQVPSSRKLWAKGPRDRRVCMTGRIDFRCAPAPPVFANSKKGDGASGFWRGDRMSTIF